MFLNSDDFYTQISTTYTVKPEKHQKFDWLTIFFQWKSCTTTHPYFLSNNFTILGIFVETVLVEMPYTGVLSVSLEKERVYKVEM